MPQEPYIEGENIVLVGSFTPSIFQPAWLAFHNLIRQQEADAAKIQLIHPSATVFQAEWLLLSVAEDRLHVGTTQASHFEVLRDLVVGILEILEQTPLTALGINREFHYKLSSEEAWHNVGHILAPKEPWGSTLNKPGMRSVLMEGVRPDSFKGYIRVKVEPSVRVNYGLFIEVNDHFQISPDPGPPMPARAVTDILVNHWLDARARADQIARRLAEIASLD